MRLPPRPAWPARPCSARSCRRSRTAPRRSAHQHARPPARGRPGRADDPHLLGASRVVRPLREDVRRAARGLHAAGARAAALDRRACRHRRPRLAHDRGRRRARPDGPLRHPRDADRRGHDAPDGRGRRLGEPDRGVAVHRGRARARGRHALVPEARAGRLSVGARRRTRRSRARSARRSKAAARWRR